MAALLFLLFTVIAHVLANTEKTIFLGPDPSASSVSEELSTLHLDILNPDNWSLRTRLRAEFPSPELPQGAATWFILDGLTPGQRYEVRVCWPATQPTAFTLKTYTPSTVYSNPALLSSLQDYYSASRQPSTTTTPKHDSRSSTLLLQILASADFYTTNTTLMISPPPVDTDVILDPYLANVLPRSLAGTAVYLVVVGALAYLGLARGARWVISELVRSSSQGHGEEEDDGRRKKVQ
ncbi:hypothetical protein VTJ49DRAFT_637 [Mycothermus thermophilus]|uniref:Uncharacterized protein n=1 Tax=Humicola insolens TaxID=85995 RepID=A0ABR3VQ97_HUMIN